MDDAADRPTAEQLAERGGDHDSAGRPERAADDYRAAIDAGLGEPELSRVVIQYGSTLRNLGRHDEGLELLRSHFRDRPDHELAPAAAAFAALALATSGREREAVAELIRGILPTLPRYRVSLAAYADALERGELASPRD